MSTRFNRYAPIAAATLIAAAGLLVAGPLDPPVGPVTSTYKTLNEVEPRIPINATNTPGDANSSFKITQPGSYYLTGNITGVAARHGIEIGASNVSIDLRGFAVVGIAGSLDGISHDALTVDNIRIENGNISGWGGDGIQLSDGLNHTVRGINTRLNGGNGIIIDENAIIESCTASANTLSGLFANGANGAIRGCSADANLVAGIRLFGSGSITGCTSYANATGFLTGLSAVVADCSARDNTGDGISVSSSCVVRDCTAYSNGDDGIICSSTSTTITNCTASFNTGDGIEVPGNCSLVGNTCDANGQGVGVFAGIKVTGTDCRIDGNTLMRNDIGMDVQLAGSFIIRNAAAGNTTNYQIIASNKVGTIVSAPNSAAVNGSTGGAGVGSTDPWANFSY